MFRTMNERRGVHQNCSDSNILKHFTDIVSDFALRYVSFKLFFVSSSPNRYGSYCHRGDTVSFYYECQGIRRNWLCSSLRFATADWLSILSLYNNISAFLWCWPGSDRKIVYRPNIFFRVEVIIKNDKITTTSKSELLDTSFYGVILLTLR